GISEGDRTHAIVNIKIKDPNKVPGVGFDMNRIMGIGYGIEKACEKAGINAFIAGGYIGNNAQLYLSKDNPIIESVHMNESFSIEPGDEVRNKRTRAIYTVKDFDPEYNRIQLENVYDGDGDEDVWYSVDGFEPVEDSNEEILAQYRKFLGNAMPVVETKEGEIYFEYDPKRNVLAYGGASNTGLLEMGSMEYDKNTTVQENLIRLSEEIYEKYGYPDEE
ncbi:MAG: hypothetical protein J6W60_10940, partial [Treponema sp.]|nr:hypothetical protein [Treponema sp.]